MKVLKIHQHSDIKSLEGQRITKRLTTRAITLNKNNILLLHTKRYDDYSLPGGGLDDGENRVSGMVRELIEETGAQNIRDITEFGVYEEYRPWPQPKFDVQHIVSYCYLCTVDFELGETSYETYEENNGMTPVWIDINKAIEHNQNIIKNSAKKGLSVERETFLLQTIVKTLS